MSRFLKWQDVLDYWESIGVENPNNRVVVSAAVRVPDRPDVIVCGPRHFDSTMRGTIKHMLWKESDFKDQGFVDQYGVYLTREEARKLAIDNGQVITQDLDHSTQLFSEDLY